jgi:hypothetical protein
VVQFYGATSVTDYSNVDGLVLWERVMASKRGRLGRVLAQKQKAGMRD